MNSEAVQKALTKVGEKIDGRPIKVDVAEERKGGNAGGNRGGR